MAVLNCGLATISKYFNNILHEIARVFSLFVVMVTACKSQNVSIFFLIPPIAPNGGVPPTCPLYQVCERYHFKNQSVNIATQPYKSLAAASYHRSLLPRLGHCESQQNTCFSERNKEMAASSLWHSAEVYCQRRFLKFFLSFCKYFITMA